MWTIIQQLPKTWSVRRPKADFAKPSRNLREYRDSFIFPAYELVIRIIIISEPKMDNKSLPRADPICLQIDEESRVCLHNMTRNEVVERYDLRIMCPVKDYIHSTRCPPRVSKDCAWKKDGHISADYDRSDGKKYPKAIRKFVRHTTVLTGVRPSLVTVTWLSGISYYTNPGQCDEALLLRDSPTILACVGIERTMEIRRRCDNECVSTIAMADGTIAVFCGEFHRRYTHSFPPMERSACRREFGDGSNFHGNIHMQYHVAQKNLPVYSSPPVTYIVGVGGRALVRADAEATLEEWKTPTERGRLDDEDLPFSVTLGKEFSNDARLY